ncbi:MULTISPECIES: type II toxin-antitoxin system RelB/DinJ family antitoxin [unclassified Adlercreutzia]|uniref:type II toxin-antitoxin system RelB/DinJ family antitoxin n=1 Tax=unclassified Adlercreutzia TaxID=2636013 RepID=UPI0013ECE52C|nr:MULTISPECIES: type II toxin-antitoxin system RelB/DinJ family antitoxin [unclassified Adlercreutzia]
MATAIVSGRVDESVKHVADVYIRKQGLTATDVIAGVWEHIAATGEIPVLGQDGNQSRKAAAAVKLAELRARAPLGTPLASMTDEDVREELRNRD